MRSFKQYLNENYGVDLKQDLRSHFSNVMFELNAVGEILSKFTTKDSMYAVPMEFKQGMKQVYAFMKNLEQSVNPVQQSEIPSTIGYGRRTTDIPAQKIG